MPEQAPRRGRFRFRTGEQVTVQNNMTMNSVPDGGVANQALTKIDSANKNTQWSTVDKTFVGLPNVDNTSDANKPVSTAQAAADALKADKTTVDTHIANTSNPHSVTKAQVGLANADNTADTAKPVSTAQQAAIDSAVAALTTLINKKTSVRYYLNGAAQNGTALTGDPIVWIETQNTAGGAGNVVYYPTSDRTATGTAIFSSINADSIDVGFVDSANLYQKGAPVVAGNLKSVTIPITKQTFNGVVVLTINVLGSQAMSAAPNGVAVKVFWIGIAA